MSFNSLLGRTCSIRRMYDTGIRNDVGEYIRALRTVARNVKCTYEESGIPTNFEGQPPTDYSKTRYTFFLPFRTNIRDGDYIHLHNVDQAYDLSSYSSSSSSSQSSSSSSSSQEYDSWSSSSSNSSSSSSSSQEFSSYSSSSSNSSSSNSSSSNSSSSSSTSREPYPWSSSSSSNSSSSNSSSSSSSTEALTSSSSSESSESSSSSSSDSSSSSSSETLYAVVGAGTSAANGTYMDYGNLNGKPTYKKIGEEQYIYWATFIFGLFANAWCISDSYGVDSINLIQYYSITEDDLPPSGGWGTGGAGTPPAPTVGQIVEAPTSSSSDSSTSESSDSSTSESSGSSVSESSSSSSIEFSSWSSSSNSSSKSSSSSDSSSSSSSGHSSSSSSSSSSSTEASTSSSTEESESSSMTSEEGVWYRAIHVTDAAAKGHHLEVTAERLEHFNFLNE